MLLPSLLMMLVAGLGLLYAAMVDVFESGLWTPVLTVLMIVAGTSLLAFVMLCAAEIFAM